MKSINMMTESNLSKFDQLEHRRQLELYAKKKREKARQDALTFMIGKLVLECWPSVSKLRLQRTKAKNEVGFAPLRKLLVEIISDPYYSILVNEIASGNEEVV